MWYSSLDVSCHLLWELRVGALVRSDESRLTRTMSVVYLYGAN